MKASEYLSDGIAAFEAKEFAIAIPILSTLADQGEAEAQFRIAIIHQNGLGHATDKQKAFDNMFKAAQQNHEFAMHTLGFMYYAGECTEQNYQEALIWFEKAAEHDMPGSMMMLSEMYKNGQGVEKDLEKSKYWQEKANLGA